MLHTSDTPTMHARPRLNMEHRRSRTTLVLLTDEEQHKQTETFGEMMAMGPRFALHLSEVLDGQQMFVGNSHMLGTICAELPLSDLLLLPWNLHEETDVFLDRVKCLLPEPVCERTVRRGMVPPLPQGVRSFGAWGQPLNARDHLERWVRLSPGWHPTATLFETATAGETLSRRIAVLWSRAVVTPPMDVTQWSMTRSEVCFLLAVALDPDVQATAHERRDGTLYLDYLCNMLRTWCRHLESPDEGRAV